MKPIFIFNLNAANGKLKRKINYVLSEIQNYFNEFNYIITNNENEIDKHLNFIDQHNTIIGVGGDGTINTIINHSLMLNNKTYGIIPFGSGNDLIYTLNIPKSIKKSLQIIKNNKFLYIDLGYLKTENFSKYFLNAIGIGFDAMVAYKTNKIKFIDGQLKYYLSLIYCLFKYKYHQIKINIDEKYNNTLNPFLITIGNGKRTGGAFLLTPDAKIDDATFQVCLVDQVSIPFIIKSISKVIKGTHNTIEQVNLIDGKKIKISSQNNLYIHFDGETPKQVRDIEVTILPKRIKFIIP
ncbi:MAG TPA: YegS/Rv2252/BmrU family lipid kinase [Ignavibacteria bacterium]